MPRAAVRAPLGRPCAGNMSPPRLPPGGPSSPAPGPSTPRSHRCRCGRAALCAHGHGGQVRACRVVRARTRHACEAFASPAADAPSRARRMSHVDARSSGEGDSRPPICADEAGESWSGRGHRGCTRRCLSRAGVLGSLTRPAVRGVGGGFRSRELLPGQTAADRPDLVARVFNMKLDALLTDLWATGIFGHVLARVHTVRVPLDYL
jgi:hypothetical protein